MQTFEFSTPELALLVQHMTGGAMPFDANTAADLNSSEADLEAADEQLRERGLLVSGPLEEEADVVSPLATLLSTTLAPEMLGVLRVEPAFRSAPRGARPPEVRDVSYFSLTSDCMAHNRVDATGHHQFTEFETLDELLLVMTATVDGMEVIASHAEPLEKLLADSDAVAVLMLVLRPAEPDAVAQVISWAVARGCVWLTDRVGTDGAPLARPITASDLRAKLRHALQPEPAGAVAQPSNGSVLHQGGAI